MENLLNIIFPPSCKFCGKFGHIVCPSCLGKTKKLEQQYCIICGAESFSGFTHEKCANSLVPFRLYSLFEYEGIVRDGIKDSKYGLYEFSILKRLTEYGLENRFEELAFLEETLFVPVPVSKEKLNKRGFNHAELIANYIASKFKNIKVIDILLRSVDTPTQHDLDRKMRFENISNAFRVKRDIVSKIKGKNFCLIDDIVTSGATLLETSKVLYSAGAASVMCFTLSRKLLD